MTTKQKPPADFAAPLIRRFKSVASGVKRFPLPVFFGVAIFVCTTVFTLTHTYTAEGGTLVHPSPAILQALLASVLCFLTSSAASLAALRFRLSNKTALFLTTAAALLWIPFFFLSKDFSDTPVTHTFYAFWGLVCALFSFCIFLCVTESNKKVIFPHIFASLFFAEAAALAVFLGLSLCVFAFDGLIFSVDSLIDECLFICFVFSLAVVAVSVFLSLLQLEEEKISIPRSFGAIILYALFPLYVLLMLILYAYLLKILVQQKMPSGQINPFVSYASFFYIAFYFLLRNRENRAVSLFYKLGHIILLPCIAAQIIAVGIRFRAYGLTSARLAGMLYIACVLYFIVLTFIKDGKHTPSLFILIGALCVVLTFTPLHIKRIPVLEQHLRLEKLLHTYGYYADGSFTVPAAPLIDNIPDEKKQAIESAYRALPAELQQNYAPDKKVFEEKFGFYPAPSSESEPSYTEFNYSAQNPTIDISAYSSLRQVYSYSCSESKAVTYELDGKEYDLTDFVLNMPKNSEPFIIPVGNAFLYIREANIHYDAAGKTFTFRRYEGYLFR